MNTMFESYRQYRNQWSLGPLVPRGAGERLDADELRQRLLSKLRDSPQLNREFDRHPREVLSIAVEEAFGINGEAFCCQVKRVNVLRETSRRLFVKLPNCHFGCQAPGLVAAAPDDSCRVCGKAIACQPRRGADASPRERGTRWFIEHQLRQNVARDPDFRTALLKTPDATYREHAASLCRGRLPDYLQGVEQVVPIEESSEEIHFVVPSDVPAPENPIGR